MENENTPADGVKNQTSESNNTPSWQEKFEISKEEYAKLQELEKNKSIALKQEREQAQKMQEELEAYRKEKAELEEKEKLKKWKYEEVIESQKARIAELEEKAKRWEEYEETTLKEVTSQIEKIIEEIPKDILEKNKKFIDSLDGKLKLEFLESIKPEWKSDILNNPTSKEEKPKNDWRLWELREKKEKNWLSPSEKVEYLDLLAKNQSNI